MTPRELCLAAQQGHPPPGGLFHSHGEIQFARHGVMLAFAGSNEAIDWRYSLDCRLTQNPWGPGRVHRGFLQAALDAWRCLDEERAQSVQVVCGYSLGAAVALLVAQKLRPVQVIVWGCPRVGDREFAAGYPHPVRRIVLAPDLVEWLPPGLCHVGQITRLRGGWNPLRNHIRTLEVAS